MWFEQPVCRSKVNQELIPVGDYLLDGSGDGAERIERLEGLPEAEDRVVGPVHVGLLLPDRLAGR